MRSHRTPMAMKTIRRDCDHSQQGCPHRPSREPGNTTPPKSKWGMQSASRRGPCECVVCFSQGARGLLAATAREKGGQAVGAHHPEPRDDRPSLIPERPKYQPYEHGSNGTDTTRDPIAVGVSRGGAAIVPSYPMPRSLGSMHSYAYRRHPCACDSNRVAERGELDQPAGSTFWIEPQGEIPRRITPGLDGFFLIERTLSPQASAEHDPATYTFVPTRFVLKDADGAQFDERSISLLRPGASTTP